MKKISIIIPVYNVEQYIEQCINSVLSQNFRDYELILVDDGSIDNTKTIIGKYRDNEKINYIYKQNGGPSSARNMGITVATGEYLMFMDADDFLYDNNCLTKINNKISESNADLIMYKMAFYYEKNNTYKYEKDLIVMDSNNPIEYLKIQNRNGRVSPSPCDKVIKSSIIKNNGILFKKGIYCEDVMWSNELYLKIQTISTLNEVIYVYRQQRKGSTMTSKSVNTAIDLYNIIDYWKNYNYPSIEIKELYMNMLSFWHIILRTTFDNDDLPLSIKNNLFVNDKYFINYHENYKVNMVYKVSKLIGIENTYKVLRIYIKLRDRGLVRL